MAKHLSRLDQKNIIDVINVWPHNEKLSWEALCDEVTLLVGKRPTRQSLSSHTLIAEVFNEKKLKIKSGERNIVKPANLKIAAQRIKRLQAEVESLTKINNKLSEQFIIWQYNALLHHITREQLDKPLSKKNT
ncbi:hypothetical protein [Erwinia aphidicola]|uniref:hypothetical protein n=1 Tax=Erwinia aphidicola TaxID=68334 RepID=UPI0030173FE5